MSLIRLRQVTKRYDNRLVLREVCLRVRAGERIGLVGPNGSGKTTILRLMLGRDEPTEGDVEIAAGVRLGYFSQFSELDSDLSVQQVLEEVLAEVRAVEHELGQIEEALNAEPTEAEMTALLDRQAPLMEEMHRRDGWNWQNRIDTVLSRMEFAAEDRRRPLHQLSGGWRNRAALAKILLEEPDVLLLDEPTNYLDIEGVTWLQEWLVKFHGAAVVVSHDRDFLDQIVTRLVEVENHRTQEYEGGYTHYVRERRMRLKTIQSTFVREQEMLVYESEAAADRKDAQRDPSGHLNRKLANIMRAATPRPVDLIVTGLYERLRLSDQLLTVEQLGKSFAGRTLFSDLSFVLTRGERLAIIGPNGCGKSTLLRVILGDEPANTGRAAFGPNVICASFNEILTSLDPSITVDRTLHGHLGIAYNAPRKKVQHFLELMQFSEMDWQQKVGDLSGGQRARLALTKCLLSGAGVLVLDEPTNHLDIPSIQVMERALANFPGAVIVASHDRFFIDKVATRLLVFTGSPKLLDVAGNWTIWRSRHAGP